jgi:peptidoglycan/xylan/chitin deacetylase (PgdA/CDA1 family)
VIWPGESFLPNRINTHPALLFAALLVVVAVISAARSATISATSPAESPPDAIAMVADVSQPALVAVPDQSAAVTPEPETPLPLQFDEKQQRLEQRAMASARGVVARSAPQAPPLSMVSAGRDGLQVPILMYHHIDQPGAGADAVRRDLSVSPVDFKAQINYLVTNGYHAITLAEFSQALESGGQVPVKSVVLTFDDGYLDNYTNALPILRDAGFRGTFFLITDFVGWGEYMSWDQARTLVAVGMDIEAHTLDHPDLTTLSPERLARQLSECRATLASQLGVTARYLSYPSGRYNWAVIRASAQAGYLAAVTTAYGDTHLAGNSFEMSRVRVHGGQSLPSFASIVGGPAPKVTAPEASRATPGAN